MSEKLQTILKEIEDGTRKYLYDVDLTIEELLEKDKDGVCFLEHLFKKGISEYSIKITDEMKNNIEIAYIFCQNNKSLFNFNFDENTLFSIVDEKKFIEYIIEQKELTFSMIEAIKEHTEIIDLLLVNDEDWYFSSITPEIFEKLIVKNSSGSYDLDKYIKNDILVSCVISSIDQIDKIMEICEHYNNYELLKHANKKILMSTYKNGNTFLEFLINDKNIIPRLLTYIPEDVDFIKKLIENKYYDYLKKSKESVQLLEIEQGKTLLEFLHEIGHDPEKISVFKEQTIKTLNKINKLDLITISDERILLKKAKELLGDNTIDDDITFLEYMLDNGCNPLSEYLTITDEQIINILIKKQRYDLLAKTNKKKLFSILDGSKTLFENIIESVKDGKTKVSISSMFPHSDLNMILEYYLIIAKHDMLEYIKEIKEEDLLKKYKEKTLLEALLEKDSSLTLNKIIGVKLKSNPKIAMILKSRGIEQQNVDVSFENNDFTSEYLTNIQGSFGIGAFQKEGEFLLNKLQQLFLTDGKSDKGLIMALVSGYRHSLLINYDVNIEELKKLIKIKEQNLDKFFYIREEEGAFFSPSRGSIFCDSDVVEILLHETGHALHFYLTNNKVPENYSKIIENARKNPDILIKTEQYANKYSKLRESIISIVEQKYQNFFETYYSEAKKEEIRSFLKKSKEEKKEEYVSLGITEEQLDVILEETFTEEEYIAHQKRIFIRENVDSILRSEFGAFIAIGDFLDAIYEGFLNSENLKNQNGEKIKSTYGHGINYYFSTSHGFDEMVAGFAWISKSKEATEMLQLLKETVGEEVYNMISDFYYQNIVGIKEEQLETGRTIGGK